MAKDLSQYNEILSARRGAIVEQWLKALAPFTSKETAEVTVRLNDWTERIIALLLAKAFERKRLEGIGEALALNISGEAQVLGQTLEILAQQLVEGFSAEQVAELYPRLVELLGALATGFTLGKEGAIKTIRGKFLSTTVHELRSPLNAIIGFSRIILKGIDGPITDLQKQDLEAIYDGGQRLLNEIGDTFKPERIIADKREFEVTSFSVEELISTLSATLQPVIEENENTLEVEYASTPGAMLSDPAKIEQVLNNLLTHANRLTKQGRIKLVVSRGATDGADWVRFQITDTGLGLTAEQVRRFRQANDPATSKYCDIGLMISQRYCALMGGEITVESEIGKGSTFVVNLPARHPGQKASA